jgi:excisionase family DNA binding protein
MQGYMSVKEAADALGVTRGRVNQLIDAGLLRAEKVGRAWIVDAESVRARAADPPPPGRRW